MTTKNPVISGLQNRRSQIKGMLSPGKGQRQPGLSLNAPLSPVASDFAGRKFKRAAQKMRTLDAGRIGQTLSRGLTTLSTDIHSKFEDIQNLIHINPGTSRENNIWSSVETPFPAGQATRQENPSEPGVMRAGSVIQKMSMVPKPGQSLDSFKKQVQSKTSPTRTSVDKKPVIDRNTRRFSRVQEVTPGQTLSPLELPAVPVKPDETPAQKLSPPEVPAVPLKKDETSAQKLPPLRPDETQPPVVQAKDVSETTTIQSQPDPGVPVSEKTVIPERVETPKPQPAEKDLAREMPLRAKPRISQPDTTPSEPQIPPQPRLAETPVAQPEDKPEDSAGKLEVKIEQPQSQKPPREKELLKALPVTKKPPVQEEIKKALPVIKDQKEPKKPVARPAIIRTDAIAATIRPAIQRQPDLDGSLVDPVSPAKQQIQQTTARSSDQAATLAPAGNDAGKPEMPLQHNIDYRRDASHALRTIAPDQMKPLSLPSLINREDAPLLTRNKYLPDLREDPIPALLAPQDSTFTPKQVQQVSPSRIPDVNLKGSINTANVEVPVAQNLTPLPMPLALPVTVAGTQKLDSKQQPAIPPVKPSLEKLPRKKSAVLKTSNTIQRAWEGHTPPSQSALEESGASNARSEPIDLETLAENVFPYVKRILEVEIDRSSGKLR